MKQEEKELLLKDLCARLSYKVYVNYDSGKDKQYEGILDDILPSRGEAYVEYCLCDIDDIRPYLRPMSSMTEEEKAEHKRLCVNAAICNDYQQVDWLNAHHFDYRGLIKKELALEAPEGMYNI